MKGLKRLFALIAIASLITLIPTLATYVYSWETSGSMGATDSSTRQNIESYGTRGEAGGTIEHQVPAETPAVESQGTARGTGSVVGSEGYGSAPGFPAGTGRGNIPPFNAPADTTTTDTSTMRGTAAPTDATTGTMQRGTGARADSMMMQPAPATTDPIKQAYQSGYKDGFTDGFKSADIQHGTRGAARGDMSMRGAAAPSPVSNDYREGYRSGFWEGFSSATAEHAPMAPGATRGDTSLQQQPSDSMMQQDSSMMNGSMRGTTDSSMQSDVSSGTTRGAGDIQSTSPSDMKSSSSVGAEGYGSAPGFPPSTGPGNVPPFNEPNSAATRGSNTMGAPDSSMGAAGSARGSAGMQQPSGTMMMQPAPATTDPIKQAYQSGYKDGFTDGFKSADIQHGTRGAARGDMSMRGAAAPSPVSNDYQEGYRSGFWEGFSSATAEHAPMAPGATRGDTSLQQQPSDSMMQQDSSMMNGSMRGGADLEGGNTQLDTVNGTTRGGATQQDSSMMNDSMRGTTDSSSGAAQGSSY